MQPDTELTRSPLLTKFSSSPETAQKILKNLRVLHQKLQSMQKTDDLGGVIFKSIIKRLCACIEPAIAEGAQSNVIYRGGIWVLLQYAAFKKQEEQYTSIFLNGLRDTIYESMVPELQPIVEGMDPQIKTVAIEVFAELFHLDSELFALRFESEIILVQKKDEAEVQSAMQSIDKLIMIDIDRRKDVSGAAEEKQGPDEVVKQIPTRFRPSLMGPEILQQVRKRIKPYEKIRGNFFYSIDAIPADLIKQVLSYYKRNKNFQGQFNAYIEGINAQQLFFLIVQIIFFHKDDPAKQNLALENKLFKQYFKKRHNRKKDSENIKTIPDIFMYLYNCVPSQLKDRLADGFTQEGLARCGINGVDPDRIRFMARLHMTHLSDKNIDTQGFLEIMWLVYGQDLEDLDGLAPARYGKQKRPATILNDPLFVWHKKSDLDTKTEQQVVAKDDDFFKYITEVMRQFLNQEKLSPPLSERNSDIAREIKEISESDDYRKIKVLKKIIYRKALDLSALDAYVNGNQYQAIHIHLKGENGIIAGVLKAISALPCPADAEKRKELMQLALKQMVNPHVVLPPDAEINEPEIADYMAEIARIYPASAAAKLEYFKECTPSNSSRSNTKPVGVVTANATPLIVISKGESKQEEKNYNTAAISTALDQLDKGIKRAGYPRAGEPKKGHTRLATVKRIRTVIDNFKTKTASPAMVEETIQLLAAEHAALVSVHKNKPGKSDLQKALKDFLDNESVKVVAIESEQSWYENAVEILSAIAKAETNRLALLSKGTLTPEQRECLDKAGELAHLLVKSHLDLSGRIDLTRRTLFYRLGWDDQLENFYQFCAEKNISKDFAIVATLNKSPYYIYEDSDWHAGIIIQVNSILSKVDDQAVRENKECPLINQGKLNDPDNLIRDIIIFSAKSTSFLNTFCDAMLDRCGSRQLFFLIIHIMLAGKQNPNLQASKLVEKLLEKIKEQMGRETGYSVDPPSLPLAILSMCRDGDEITIPKELALFGESVGPNDRIQWAANPQKLLNMMWKWFKQHLALLNTSSKAPVAPAEEKGVADKQLAGALSPSKQNLQYLAASGSSLVSASSSSLPAPARDLTQSTADAASISASSRSTATTSKPS